MRRHGQGVTVTDTRKEDTMTEYVIHGAPITDVRVALECEADRAEREGFANVAERQRALALHIANADAHLQS
jgi:hypothetical protein